MAPLDSHDAASVILTAAYHGVGVQMRRLSMHLNGCSSLTLKIFHGLTIIVESLPFWFGRKGLYRIIVWLRLIALRATKELHDDVD